MHVHGVLSKYLQQWEKIVGQMQFDMFHFYTVDEHTVMALQNIWYFTHDDRKKREFVLFNNIYKSLQKPMLLTIATLLHDMAPVYRKELDRITASHTLEIKASMAVLQKEIEEALHKEK